MTELHLDQDEWDNILYCLRKERDGADGGYRQYLDSLVLKIELATNEEFGDPRTPQYGVAP
jgi:hypothetical protein